METETDKNVENGDAGGHHVLLSFRDGIYRLRLRLPALDEPYEVLLHGVSQLADALRVASFFGQNLCSPRSSDQSEVWLMSTA
jgi:hypothetical protein